MNDKTPHLNDSLPAPAAEDHRVLQDVAGALRSTGLFVSNRVHVVASDGVVRLQGRVASYYQKQLAQAAASTVVGDCQLVNDIEVM